LKVMRPSLAADPTTRQRFLREAQAAAAIDHDHVVHIYQVGEDGEVPFLAMQYLNGEDLEDRLEREQKLPVTEVLRIGREIAEGLAAAHEHSLIHRDIKPSNIWLEKGRDRVKILDFGLARAVEGSKSLVQSGILARLPEEPAEQVIEPLTYFGAVLGTPAYMAPEQARGEAVDFRCDLFSLGCVLYRLCTGETPFKGANRQAVLAALAAVDPPSPHDKNQEVPPALSDLVMHLLAKQPADRPAETRAVVETIKAIEHEQAKARELQTRPYRGSRRWVATAAVALLGLLGVAGYFFGSTIIRITTNRGELVVQVDDPSVEVSVKQNGVVVQDRTTQREFVLKAGEGELEVYEQASGLKLTTRQFSLARGGKTYVSVTQEVAKARAELPPAPPTARGPSPSGVSSVVVHVPGELVPRSPPRPDDWPMGGWDAGNTFCNQHEKTLAPPLVKVWECTLPGTLDSVVVNSGIVLAGGMGTDQKNKVFAVDAQNGRHLWTFTLPGGGGGAMVVSPACHGDLAFFGGQGDDNVYAIYLRTGELRWQHRDIRNMYSNSPKVAEGVLYVNSNTSGLWALDPQTGKEKWKESNAGRQSAIAVKAGCLLRAGGAYGGALAAFDARTGEQRWHTEGFTSYEVCAREDLVFVTYAGETPAEVTVGKEHKRFKHDRIAAFASRDGMKVWETTLKEDAHYGGLLLTGDSLYATTRAGRMYCLDPQTGKIRKERPLRAAWGRMIATSNLIFATTREGTCALAPNTLETLWETSVTGDLVAANGRLYVVSGPRIVAFANRKKDGQPKP
jgi:outer membrane protein assembly factor BamB